MDRKIALVTGRASAEALAHDGFTVVLTGRRLALLEQVCVGLVDDRHLAVAADVGIDTQVSTLFAKCLIQN